MKNYRVTVNGKVYDVSVEETNASSAPAPIPVAAPAPSAPAPVKAAPAVDTGAKFTVKAPMQGNILSVNVSVGQKVAKGAILCILEAMKMENEIMAPDAGTVTSVNAAKGASVETGTVLFTIS